MARLREPHMWRGVAATLLCWAAFGAAPALAQGALVITISPVGARDVPAARGPATPATITIGRDAAIVGEPVRFSRTVFASITAAPSSLLPAASRISGLPIAGMLTSSFGMRDHPLLGQRRMHSGVDIAAPAGTPIAATTDGLVTRAAWGGGYGLLVELQSGDGTATRFGHLSRLNVNAGQQVRKGDIIGFVGSTGLSTGPHVHYEVRVNNRAINPLAFR